MAGEIDGAVGTTDFALVKPPKAILGVGAVSALASVGVLAGTGRWSHVVGYVLGTFVTILVIAVFRQRDARLSTSPLYSAQTWTTSVAVAVLVVGVAAGCANVYYLAQRVG